VEPEAPLPARPVTGLHGQGVRQLKRPRLPGLALFEGEDAAENDESDRSGEGLDDDADERNNGGGGMAGSDAFDGGRRKVKRKASRIARPRDSMPGFKKGRGRSGGGGSGFRRPKNGTSTVGKKYLNRRMSVATYYGKHAEAGEEALGGTAGVLEAAGEEIGRLERELALLGPAVEIGVPRCVEHGLHCAKLKVKKRGPNKGRAFFKCAHPQRYQQCNYFVWEDEVAGLNGKTGGDGDDVISNVEQPAATVAPTVFDVSFPGESPGDDDDSDGEAGEGSLQSQLLLALRDVFAYNEFRPGQMDVMRRLLRNESALAVLPTGGGKSLCYQLFAAVTPGIVVVVTPLISLMLDQLASLPKSLPGACFRSGQTYAATLAVERALLAGELKVLFVAPERLFASRFQRFVRRLAREHVSLVVVDEAHCISEMGHNFRTSFLRLESAIFGFGDSTHRAPGLFEDTPILAMTATATSAVIRDVCSSLRIADANVVQADLARHNLRLTVSHVDGSFESKAAELIRRLRSKPFAGFVLKNADETKAVDEMDTRDASDTPRKSSFAIGAGPGWGGGGSLVIGKAKKRARSVVVRKGAAKTSKWTTKCCPEDDSNDAVEDGDSDIPGVVIVYVSKQRECETVCNYLRSSRLATRGKVEMYHAGMTLSSRANVQRDFDKGRISVLVATVAFGMGLDSKDVRGVIHFDIPFSVEAYAQEVGRAGRDGRPAACHLFMNSFDARRLRSRAHSDGVDLGTVRQFLRRLFCCEGSTTAPSKARTVTKPDSGSDESERSADEGNDVAEETSDDNGITSLLVEKEVMASYEQGEDTRFVHIPHRFLERDLDVRPDTCDTICTFLERIILRFSLLHSRPATMRLRFFSKSAAQLIEERHNRGISEESRAVLSQMMKIAKHRNGMYELEVYDSSEKSKDRPSGDHMLQVARELKAGKHVDYEMTNEALAVLIPTAIVGDTTRMNELATMCYSRLCHIENVRRGKADALVTMLHSAEAMLSDEEQSLYLHEALASYFATESPSTCLDSLEKATGRVATNEPPAADAGSGCEDGGAVVDCEDGDRKAALTRAVREVLDATAYGSRVARTPRQVARVLHGIQSPAFSAKEWCLCAQWGKYVDLDFRDVLAAATKVIRDRSLGGLRLGDRKVVTPEASWY
jgi:superfamily II DNA helicase RecQ